MTTKIAKRRVRAAAAQGHHCYYCGLPMWHSRPIRFANRHSLSEAQVRWMRCTAEHLLARCDGGGDNPGNIVAACAFCNARRHWTPSPLSAEDYRRYVASRMRSGRWLAGILPSAFVERGRLRRL